MLRLEQALVQLQKLALGLQLERGPPVVWVPGLELVQLQELELALGLQLERELLVWVREPPLARVPELELV